MALLFVLDLMNFLEKIPLNESPKTFSFSCLVLTFLLTMFFWISAAVIATIESRLRYKSYPFKASTIRCLWTFVNSLKRRMYKLLALISLIRSDFLLETFRFFSIKCFSWKDFAELVWQATSLTILIFFADFLSCFDWSPSWLTSSDQYFDPFSLHSWTSI